MTTYTILQAPPLTDYEAATAKVLGPDTVLDAPTLMGKHKVYYDLDLDTAERVIASNVMVWESRYAYQGDEKVKGACFIEVLECGCVYELTGPDGGRGANFQKCQEHSHRNEGWCCDKSVGYSCVCIMAQWCPEHGDQHHGTHD